MQQEDDEVDPEDDPDFQMDFDTFMDQLRENHGKYWVTEIWEKKTWPLILDACRCALLSSQDAVVGAHYQYGKKVHARQVGNKQVFREGPRAFELYGIDFSLDYTLTPYLLEANVSPDLLGHSGPKLRDHGREALDELLTLVLREPRSIPINNIPSDQQFNKECIEVHNIGTLEQRGIHRLNCCTDPKCYSRHGVKKVPLALVCGLPIKDKKWSLFLKSPRFDPELLSEQFSKRKNEEWSERSTHTQTREEKANGGAGNAGYRQTAGHEAVIRRLLLSSPGFGGPLQDESNQALSLTQQSSSNSTTGTTVTTSTLQQVNNNQNSSSQRSPCTRHNSNASNSNSNTNYYTGTRNRDRDNNPTPNQSLENIIESPNDGKEFSPSTNANGNGTLLNIGSSNLNSRNNNSNGTSRRNSNSNSNGNANQTQTQSPQGPLLTSVADKIQEFRESRQDPRENFKGHVAKNAYAFGTNLELPVKNSSTNLNQNNSNNAVSDMLNSAEKLCHESNNNNETPTSGKKSNTNIASSESPNVTRTSNKKQSQSQSSQNHSSNVNKDNSNVEQTAAAVPGSTPAIGTDDVNQNSSEVNRSTAVTHPTFWDRLNAHREAKEDAQNRKESSGLNGNPGGPVGSNSNTRPNSSGLISGAGKIQKSGNATKDSLTLPPTLLTSNSSCQSPGPGPASLSSPKRGSIVQIVEENQQQNQQLYQQQQKNMRNAAHSLVKEIIEKEAKQSFQKQSLSPDSRERVEMLNSLRKTGDYNETQSQFQTSTSTSPMKEVKSSGMKSESQSVPQSQQQSITVSSNPVYAFSQRVAGIMNQIDQELELSGIPKESNSTKVQYSGGNGNNNNNNSSPKEKVQYSAAGIAQWMKLSHMTATTSSPQHNNSNNQNTTVTGVTSSLNQTTKLPNLTNTSPMSPMTKSSQQQVTNNMNQESPLDNLSLLDDLDYKKRRFLTRQQNQNHLNHHNHHNINHNQIQNHSLDKLDPLSSHHNHSTISSIPMSSPKSGTLNGIASNVVSSTSLALDNWDEFPPKQSQSPSLTQTLSQVQNQVVVKNQNFFKSGPSEQNLNTNSSNLQSLNMNNRHSSNMNNRFNNQIPSVPGSQSQNPVTTSNDNGNPLNQFSLGANGSIQGLGNGSSSTGIGAGSSRRSNNSNSNFGPLRGSTTSSNHNTQSLSPWKKLDQIQQQVHSSIGHLNSNHGLFEQTVIGTSAASTSSPKLTSGPGMSNGSNQILATNSYLPSSITPTLSRGTQQRTSHGAIVAQQHGSVGNNSMIVTNHVTNQNLLNLSNNGGSGNTVTSDLIFEDITQNQIQQQSSSSSQTVANTNNTISREQRCLQNDVNQIMTNSPTHRYGAHNVSDEFQEALQKLINDSGSNNNVNTNGSSPGTTSNTPSHNMKNTTAITSMSPVSPQTGQISSTQVPARATKDRQSTLQLLRKK